MVKQIRSVLLFYSLLILLIIPSYSFGACQSTGTKDWTTDGNEYADVKECIDEVAAAADKDGHTIHVIAGDGEATWSTTVVSTGTTPNLKIIGPGKSSLKVIMGTSPSIHISETNTRISGFHFYTTTNQTAVYARGVGWRVDNCKYEYAGATGTNGVFVDSNATNITYQPFGLVDSNEVINGKVLVMGAASFAKMGATWFDDIDMGTDEAVYIENNTFTTDHNYGTNCVDNNRGGKYVFRYNDAVQCHAEAHYLMNRAVDSTAIRATRKTEIYNNTFHATGNAAFAAMYIRGGTGVAFNNVVTEDSVGYWNYTVNFDYPHGDVSEYCDGDHGMDGNETITSTVTAYGGGATPGTGKASANDATGVTLATSRSGGDVWATDKLIGGTVFNDTDGSSCTITDNDGTTITCAALSGGTDNQWAINDDYHISDGHPCRDQIGTLQDASLWDDPTTLPAPSQTLQPYLTWGNTLNGNTAVPHVDGDGRSQYLIVSGRDFCDHATTMPASCNGVTTTYERYTCPHPLVGTGSCDPATAGRGGYHLGNATNATIGSGASMSIGAGAVMTLH